jgi:hypothetical protein
MNKETILNIFSKLEDDDLKEIAYEFSIYLENEIEIETRCDAIKYISNIVLESQLKGKESEELLINSVGSLIAYTKFNDVFNDVSQALKLETGINPNLGFTDDAYADFRFPVYKDICSLFVDTSTLNDHRDIW